MLSVSGWAGADSKDMDLSAEIAGDEQALLDLEFRASEPYTRFVYSSIEQAWRVRRYLFERNLCEFSPPHGRLLRDGGRAIGLLAVLSGADLSRSRLKAGLTLTKSDFLVEDPGLAARLHLAGQALLKVLPEDFYISRVATTESEQRRGVGTYLVRQAEIEARARGHPRIVLEVSPRSTAALQLYRREGYRQIDTRQVTDSASGRSLEYLHLVKTLS